MSLPCRRARRFFEMLVARRHFERPALPRLRCRFHATGSSMPSRRPMSPARSGTHTESMPAPSAARERPHAAAITGDTPRQPAPPSSVRPAPISPGVEAGEVLGFSAIFTIALRMGIASDGSFGEGECLILDEAVCPSREASITILDASPPLMMPHTDV